MSQEWTRVIRRITLINKRKYGYNDNWIEMPGQTRPGFELLILKCTTYKVKAAIVCMCMYVSIVVSCNENQERHFIKYIL